MVTMVGNESTFEKLIKDLVSLEYDAIAAYESTIERLDDKTLSAHVETFLQDHLQHLSTLEEIAAEAGIEAPTEGDMKQILTTGKIALADLMGDAAILKAMKTNEDDTVTAYERASQHQDAFPESKAFFAKAHADEVRHRAWFGRPQRLSDPLGWVAAPPTPPRDQDAYADRFDLRDGCVDLLSSS